MASGPGALQADASLEGLNRSHFESTRSQQRCRAVGQKRERAQRPGDGEPPTCACAAPRAASATDSASSAGLRRAMVGSAVWCGELRGAACLKRKRAWVEKLVRLFSSPQRDEAGAGAGCAIWRSLRAAPRASLPFTGRSPSATHIPPDACLPGAERQQGAVQQWSVGEEEAGRQRCGARQPCAAAGAAATSRAAV